MSEQESYTDADVELAIRAAARARYLVRWPGNPARADRYACEMAADSTYRAEMTAALDALAAAGLLATPVLTDDDLDAIVMRALAATREPWHVEYLGEHGYPQRIANDAAVVVAETHDGSGAPAANAEFIAHARSDVPRLIAMVRRLRSGGLRVTNSHPQPWEIRATATGGGPCGTCGKPFYTHVCISCSPDYQTPGPGCVNCRNTGMDQTPCSPPTREG